MMLKTFFKRLAAGFSIFTATASAAYDNSRFPPFDTVKAGRGFQDISIHPNGEDWLISECTSNITGYPSCYLFTYNLRDHSYKRFSLPLGYSYSDGKFSPSGQKILAIRQPAPKANNHEEIMKSYAQGEIVIMNRDGSELKVLPLRPNRVMSPVMSPDETRVAYLVAESDKPYVKSVSFAFFEIWEYNLTSRENALFAGPMRFYHATTLNYLSNSEILAGALAPESIASNEYGDYFNKFQGSEIFRISRGMRYAPEPVFYDLPYARYPSADAHGNVFFETQPQKIGFSLTQKSSSGHTKIWRAPLKNKCVVSKYLADPSGSYVSFIYGGDPIASKDGRHALGYFDVQKETWHPVYPPPLSQ